MNGHREKGFTLVELVMVIILIGILSVSAIGLFATTGAFTSLAGRDLLLSSALLAQQKALSNPQPGSPVSLAISQSAGSWTFSVSQGGTSYQRSLDRSASSTLSVNGTPLANGGTQTLAYSPDASTGANTAIVFQDENTHRMCIASTGFPYTGPCQP